MTLSKCFQEYWNLLTSKYLIFVDYDGSFEDYDYEARDNLIKLLLNYPKDKLLPVIYYLDSNLSDSKSKRCFEILMCRIMMYFISCINETQTEIEINFFIKYFDCIKSSDFEDINIYVKYNKYIDNIYYIFKMIPNTKDMFLYEYILQNTAKNSNIIKILSNKLRYETNNLDNINDILRLCYRYGDYSLIYDMEHIYTNSELHREKILEFYRYKKYEMIYFIRNIEDIGHIDTIFINILSYLLLGLKISFEDDYECDIFYFTKTPFENIYMQKYNKL